MNSNKPSNSCFRLFPGLWIVISIVLLLGARTVWKWLRYPHGIDKLAKQLSSMYVIQKQPAVNRTHSLLAVIHTTEHGVAVFIENLADKTEQKICEVTDVDYKASYASLFGWSPDDKILAYSWDRRLHFVENDGSEPNGNLDESTNHIQSFTWLSTDECAYIDDAPSLVHVKRFDGRWESAGRWNLPATNGTPRSIQAIRPNIVAWQTANAIWHTDLSSGASKLLYSNFRRQIESISYSANAGAFLAIESTNRGKAYYLLSILAEDDSTSVTELLRKPSILSAQWINHGHGYVYASQVGGNVILAGKTEIPGKDKEFFMAGKMEFLFSDETETRFFVLGAQISEPVGVWECDANSGKTQCLLSPCSGVDFHYQPVLAGWAPYGDKHSAAYDLLQPAQFSRHKKYPLVIGLGSYEWTPIAHGIYAQCLANSGAYVAFVHYRWNQRQPDTVYAHTNNFMAVYNEMARNPNVDLTRVYIFGFSAGTSILSELGKQYPGRWRGIMLLNPSPLPDPHAGLARRVLATAGSDDGDEMRFRKFQEDLAKVGIPMEWHIHQNAQHVVRDKTAMYERTLWMGDITFEK
jgi:predicted esterase